MNPREKSFVIKIEEKIYNGLMKAELPRSKDAYVQIKTKREYKEEHGIVTIKIHYYTKKYMERSWDAQDRHLLMKNQAPYKLDE